MMGTGQCVLLCSASWLGRRVERGTWQARVAGHAAAIGPVLQSRVAHPSIDLLLLGSSQGEMVS